MARLVVYQSILEPFEPLETLIFQSTTIGAPLYIQEAYCSNPTCDCHEAYLAFHRLDEEGKAIEELFRLRVDLKKKDYHDLEVKNNMVSSHVVDEFMANLDLYIEDLTNHYQRVKDYYRTYIPEERLPQLYQQYERNQYVDYQDLFSGELLLKDGLLILDAYRFDEEAEPTVQLTLIHGEEGTSTAIVNLPQRTYRWISGQKNDKRMENLLNGPMYERLVAHCETMKKAGKKIAKAGMRLGKIGRNDPCPCGSGKKYKFCHGKSG